MKHGKNKYYRRSRISEKVFRRLIRAFAMEPTATDAAELTGLSVRSVNPIYLKVRQRIADAREGHTAVTAGSPSCSNDSARTPLRALSFLSPPKKRDLGVAHARPPPPPQTADNLCYVKLQVSVDPESCGRLCPCAQCVQSLHCRLSLDVIPSPVHW